MFTLIFIYSCSDSKEYKSNKNIEIATINSNLNYITQRDSLNYQSLDKFLTRINDSSIAAPTKIIEYYEGTGANFALLDFNKDGYIDLFFEYYGASGFGIKNRIDIYLFKPNINQFNETIDLSVMNPSYYIEENIITEHYIGSRNGYAFKYKLYNERIDTLEKININISSICLKLIV